MKIRVDGRPLYIRAEEALSELIVRRYQPGDKLSPDPTLAQHLGISHSTFREALRSFEEQGPITGRQGVGLLPTCRVRPSTATRKRWSVPIHWRVTLACHAPPETDHRTDAGK